MWQRLQTLRPRIERWAFIGGATFLIVFYGLGDQEQVPDTPQGYRLIDGPEYIDLLERDVDNTVLIDARTEFEQRDVHANAIGVDLADPDIADYIATHSGELEGKNLVFMCYGGRRDQRILNDVLAELKTRDIATDDFQFYSMDGGEALTEVPPWRRMSAMHIGRATADAWTEQGHVHAVDLDETARNRPAVLTDATLLHKGDPRPLVVHTARPAAEVERGFFPSAGLRYYVKTGATDPPAWMLSTLGRAGHLTSPWLVYLLMNLAGLGLLLRVTARLQSRPRQSALARLAIGGLFVYGLLLLGNGVYEFRPPDAEDFALYFGLARLMALCIMVLALWLLRRKGHRWLSRPTLLVLLLPIIWGASKLSFMVLPPHAYVTYHWLASLCAFCVVAVMGPELLAWRTRRGEASPVETETAAAA